MPNSLKYEWFDFSTLMGAPKLGLWLSGRELSNARQPLAAHRESLAAERGYTLTDLAIPRQVHGVTVAWAGQGGLYPDTDGLLTTEEKVILTLQVADCAAVYLYHAPTRTRGLVHAGWRGVAGGVLEAAVDQFRERAINIQELAAVIGPVIGPECYEVGPEVAARFDDQFLTGIPGGSYQLDLPGAIKSRLVRVGIPDANVAGAGICTKCDPRCHSYRRDGQRAGRMIAFFSEGD